MLPIKASIIILDFMKASRVIENINSIFRQKRNFEIEIIIIDNSVNKKNATILQNGCRNLKNIKLLISKKNLGYPKGNNIGAQNASGEYIFIVNPDIIWRHDDTLEKMITFLESNPDTGIVGPRQINKKNNEREITARKFPTLFLQVARRTFLRQIPTIKEAVEADECLHIENINQEVDWLQSSFFAMKKSFWDEIGGFDEDFFLFMSDTEICYQSWKKGKKVMYITDTTVYADGIRCSDGGFKDFFKKSTIQQHLKDSLKYFRKHLFEINPRKKAIQKER